MINFFRAGMPDVVERLIAVLGLGKVPVYKMSTPNGGSSLYRLGSCSKDRFVCTGHPYSTGE